jgi:hypothetical protein
MEFREPLGSGEHWQVSASVVPRDARELGHELAFYQQKIISSMNLDGGGI